MFTETSPRCPGCQKAVAVPYIQCLDCHLEPPVTVCLSCFACGYSNDKHRNSHSYTVVKDDFPVFCGDWQAKEELQLLENLSEFGQGNWEDVANRIQRKNRQQCERHYMQYYVERPVCPTMPILLPRTVQHKCFPLPAITCDHPPRPSEGTMLWKDMAGYCAPRGDFVQEYNNWAEEEVSQLDVGQFDDVHVSSESHEMKMLKVESYLQKLREREKLKRVIRDYGLIDVRKLLGFEKRLEIKLRSSRRLAIRSFVRMMRPESMMKGLESLILESEIKTKIKKLMHYRQNGITSMEMTRMYEQLKQRREKQRLGNNMLSQVLSHFKDKRASYLGLGAIKDIGQSARRTAARLDVEHLPLYGSLSADEQEFCAAARFVPKAYTEFKGILNLRCQEQGFLHLAQARPLIKIDVNKIRKLYDFLIEQGLVWQHPK